MEGSSLTESPRIPPALVFPSQRRIFAIRVVLGLTVYLDQELDWARRGAAKLFDSFVARVGAERLRWMITSHMDSWREVGPREIAEIREALVLPATARSPRHLLKLQVADAPGPFELGLAYREVDPARGTAGYLQIALPATTSPRDLLDLAVEIGQRWPVRCLIGGFEARPNAIGLPSAFDGIYRWCRRYVGLDVQWPDAAARRVESGLPGTNWLTLVGSAWGERVGIDTAALAQRRWDHPVRVMPVEAGPLVIAGEAPDIGDLNRLSLPFAMCEVARVLGPHFIDDPSFNFFGDFAIEERTRRWMRRLIDPATWD